MWKSAGTEAKLTKWKCSMNTEEIVYFKGEQGKKVSLYVL